MMVLCYNGWFVWGKTVIDIITEIRTFWYICNKNGLSQCLVVFSIVISLLSLIRSLLELALFGFPLQERLHTRFWTDPRSKRKTSEIPPAAPIPPQNHSTELSAPFQLHSKPNSSPQRTIQSSESKKAYRSESVIMLPAPTVDTFETRMECRANKLTLTRGREEGNFDYRFPPTNL